MGVQGLKGSGFWVQRFRGSGVQRFWVQRFRGSGVQRFRGSEVQGSGFRGSEVQSSGFRGSEVQGSEQIKKGVRFWVSGVRGEGRKSGNPKPRTKLQMADVHFLVNPSYETIQDQSFFFN